MGPCENFVQQLSCQLWALAIPSATTQAESYGPTHAYRQRHPKLTFGPMQSCRQETAHAIWAHVRISSSSSPTSSGPLQSHRQQPKQSPMGPRMHIVKDILS